MASESADVVEDMAIIAGVIPVDLTIEERRASLSDMAKRYGPAAAPVARVDERLIAGPGGPLSLRIYHPVSQRPGARIMVQFHGGGWALGGPSTYELQSRAICAASETVLVDLDYRLAPEHKFPAAIDDCMAALRWSLEFAGDLGLPDDRAIVVGDSAGGYLAALVCQMAPALVAGQVLIYPVLTVGRGNDRSSRRSLGSGEYFLTFDAITNAEYEFFEGVGVKGADGPSPLLADAHVLATLPPTLIILAGMDPLVDEGLEYAERLRLAGAPVRQLVEEGAIHGFVLFSGAITAGMKCFAEIGAFVRNC
ncbi:alpha/beta hydrolase [Croceicoccus bisphenolivorans]|uniref:alpha/beta hydrolase n=1 Tax=Croceicoccus bisphenolivorans TaxID=1783232 RepID=UPI00082D2882|nr:alpha/beta hydrolase [Croceicoccus bisphenolivorans]